MIKSLVLERIVLNCYLWLIVCSLFSCDNRVVCMSPPPQIAVQIMDGTLTYPADLDTAARLEVSYVDKNQQKFVGDLTRNGDVFISYMLIENARNANDPEFSFELNGRVLAKMKLETYLNYSKCNGWAAISKVYQNGKVVPRLANGAYLMR